MDYNEPYTCNNSNTIQVSLSQVKLKCMLLKKLK